MIGTTRELSLSVAWRWDTGALLAPGHTSYAICGLIETHRRFASRKSTCDLEHNRLTDH
jgi:hypothetical protein